MLLIIFHHQVAYMDPGNWAVSIEAGSRFGYQLVSVTGAWFSLI